MQSALYRNIYKSIKMEILEYIIVEETTRTGLSKIVNEYIQEGYQPFGNLVVRGNQYVSYYVQAIVKYK